MIQYFQRVPSGAVRREIDGNDYAYSNCKLQHTSGGKITVVDTARARLRRVSAIVNGEAHLYLGCAGEAIAGRVNLPFSVDAVASNTVGGATAAH